jgi:arsenical pump membrane protein
VPFWLLSGLAGVAVTATGLLPLQGADSAFSVVSRISSIMVFLLAITVLAELCDVAGLFDAVAVVAARAARGHTWLLFAGVAVVGTAATVVLSLDTTAVMLTPVVLALASRLGLRPAVFAFAAVWLANTASLLLPASNLTNMLAQNRLGITTVSFAVHMVAPAAAAVATTVTVLALRFRRDLTSSFTEPDRKPPPDRVLFMLAGIVCVLIVPAFLIGLPGAAVAVAAAAILATGFVARRRDVLRIGLIPWKLVVSVTGLLLLVTAAGRIGLESLAQHGIATGTSPLQLLRTAATSAIAANAVNNLPAYLALERAVPDGHAATLLAVLIGVNVGPLITLHGSLATLLWRQRCRAADVDVPVRQFTLLGLLLVPLTLTASTLALAASS